MILEFSIENFKSFRDLQTLTMQTANLKEKNESNNLYNRTFKVNDNLSIVKTKVIFGGNASGKSNIISAMSSFWQIIFKCLQPDNVLNHKIEPYRLDKDCVKKPSYFQIILFANGEQYRYGFEADREKIYSEWLYVKKVKREVLYFLREGDEITEFNENSFSEIKQVKDKKVTLFKSDTLVLSVLNALNTKITQKVFKSIISDISLYSADKKAKDHWTFRSTESYVLDNDFQKFTNDLMKNIDNTIIEFGVRRVKEKNKEEDALVTVRMLNGKEVFFKLDEAEAEGTQKVFSLSRPIYTCLKYGETFIIDEFDARLHPKLTRQIIALFYSKHVHPEAQLIFVSHDSNLLDSELMRRDQIAFIEKSKSGASEIFDLSDVKGVRENDLFEKNYLRGKYGGLPYLQNLENIFIDGEKVTQ